MSKHSIFPRALGLVAALALLTLAGCATNPMFGTGAPQASARSYTSGAAQAIQNVYLGTVLAVRGATIASSPSGAGALLGGVAGAALGHQIGAGTGRTVAEIAGGLLGMLGGQAAEGRAGAQAGEIVTVRLDNGQILAVTQAADVPLRPGERIQLLISGAAYGQAATARVLPLS